MADKTQARIIRRYQNRKLYDTYSSKYVTLEDIAEMIKKGVDVKVVDNKTKKDLTTLTLTQIIFEEEKNNKQVLPLAALRRIIQSKSESLHDAVDKLVTPGVTAVMQARQEVERVVDRLVRRGNIQEEDRANILSNFYASTTRNLEEISKRFEENVKSFVDRTRTVTQLNERVGRLEEELRELETLAAKKPRARKPRKPKSA